MLQKVNFYYLYKLKGKKKKRNIENVSRKIMLLLAKDVADLWNLPQNLPHLQIH